MLQQTTKLEINIRRGKSAPQDMDGVGTLMVKNRIPALVTDPDFIDLMLFERMRINGQYKIITTVDFENGKQYAMDKFRSLPQNALKTDGFEILLSPDRTDKESLNELRIVTEFCRQSNPLAEIRWVFGFRTRQPQQLQHFYPYLKKWPAQFLRTDINLEVPGLTITKHLEDVTRIRNFCGTSIKVSGNINLAMIKELSPRVARFDVNVSQAKRILFELKEENNKPAESVKENKSAESVEQAVTVLAQGKENDS